MGSIPGLGRSPGGRNGDPLQYSCLKNPPDRGAWQAPVRRVTKIQMPSLHAAHKVSIPTPGDRPTLGVWVTHGTWPCLGTTGPHVLVKASRAPRSPALHQDSAPVLLCWLLPAPRPPPWSSPSPWEPAPSGRDHSCPPHLTQRPCRGSVHSPHSLTNSNNNNSSSTNNDSSNHDNPLHVWN